MKRNVKVLKMAVLAVVVLFCAPAVDAGAREVKVKVTGIKEGKGNIMVAAGDRNDAEKMAAAKVPASGKSVVVKLDIPDGEHHLYVFHDENGNMDLDRDAAGKPLEGCYMGKINVAENSDAAEVKLWYFLPGEETATDK